MILSAARPTLSGNHSPKGAELTQYLLEKAALYNHPRFVETDPIQIPRSFATKEDIEISAFLVSVIAWGQRTSIINSGRRLMALMHHAPHRFITTFGESDLAPFRTFVHRTFNGDDCMAFLHALQRIYLHEGGLEQVLSECFKGDRSHPGRGWSRFEERFFSGPHLPRSRKHLPDPMKGSAAKRMNMFLRWMVRRDNAGVDFGIWQQFQPSQLYLPLDVHTARVARRLGLLRRKQDDWKAVLSLTRKMRTIDPADPARLDFALFGIGAFEKF